MRNYTCLVTRESKSIPSSIPHFNSHGITTIPIDLEYGWFTLIEILDLYSTGLPILTDLDKDIQSSDAGIVIKLIYILDLQTCEFGILFKSDWGPPLEDIQLFFKSGKVVQDSIYIADHNSGEISGLESKMFEYLGIPVKDPYGTIAHCENYYDALGEYKKRQQF